ncbi:MAG: MFS transporter [Candidatus Dormibacteria bacterium]
MSALAPGPGGENAEPRVELSQTAPLHASRPAVPPRAEDAAGFIRVLRRRDFRLLWGAQVASQLADKFFAFTLLIVTYDISKAASLPSVLMVAYTLPSVFFSAPAGVYADRHDKRRLMFATNVVRAGLILLVPATQFVPPLQDQAWPLLIITFLFSSVGQVFAPAEAASIPSLVSREQIMGATSLFMTTVILTLVIAVPLAPLTIRIFGDVYAPFYIAAGLFGCAALFILLIGASLRATPLGAATDTHVIQELREGIAILRHTPALRIGLLQLALALVVVFTLFALGPAYLKTELGRDDKDTYLVLIPATLGLIGTAGVLGQRAVGVSRRSMMAMAMITAGACLVAIGVGPRITAALALGGLQLPLVIVLSLVFGIALGAILIPAFTVLQERSDPETRGRIFGGIFTVINAAIAVPLVAAGVAADLLHSVGGVLAGSGAILIALALFFRALGWSWLAVLDEP